MTLNNRHGHIVVMIEEIMNSFYLQLVAALDILFKLIFRKRKRISNTEQAYTLLNRIPTQVQHLNRLLHTSDSECIVNLRMDRNTFGRLCHLLKHLGGLTDGKYVSVEEQVALFLGILAHHKKIGVVAFDFWRSGQTVSHYVHVVLRAIINLHHIFLVEPTPVQGDCQDPRWKWFKGCMGALDGTYINVTVPSRDKPRYRTRKGQISTNTLAVCDRDMKFVYVLPGWEGSAADGRILRDAVNRPHGLKVPRGCYYLCDNGYANSEGFLTPYKGVRYHLKEWGPESDKPKNAEELYNLRHTRARNVIERAFGVLKMRWGILRSASYYPVKVQTRLIHACFLLHNFIRGEMPVDPIELDLDEAQIDADHDDSVAEDFIDMVEATTAWTQSRNLLAQDMWQNWLTPPM